MYEFDIKELKKTRKPRARGEAQRRPVFRVDNKGKEKRYDSIKDAAIKNGTYPAGINQACKGRDVGLRLKRGGYFWRYEKKEQL